MCVVERIHFQWPRIDRLTMMPMVVPLFHFGARKLMFWSANVATVQKRVNMDSGTIVDAWRCVGMPVVDFPPYVDRSGDKLFVGGGLCLS